MGRVRKANSCFFDPVSRARESARTRDYAKIEKIRGR